MQVFEFVIVVVIVVTIGSIFRDRQRIKAGYPPMFGRRRGRGGEGDRHQGEGCPLCANGEDAEAVKERLARLEGLEERIQVLERIVTDSRSTLADDIDNL